MKRLHPITSAAAIAGLALASGSVFAAGAEASGDIGVNAETTAPSVNAPGTPSAPSTPSTPSLPSADNGQTDGAMEGLPSTGDASDAGSGNTTPEIGQDFAELDTNNDEVISRAEAASNAALADRFASVDASGDGEISQEEFSASAEANAESGTQNDNS